MATTLLSGIATKRRGLTAFALLLTLAIPGAAGAQEKSAADLRKEANDSLFKGDVAAACVAFEQAYQLAQKAPPDDPGPKANELLFDLADCHERQGYATLAVKEIEQVAALGGGNAADAKTRAAKLGSGGAAGAAGDKPAGDAKRRDRIECVTRSACDRGRGDLVAHAHRRLHGHAPDVGPR